MYWKISLVLVCLMVTWVRCEHGQYGFVEQKLIETQCVVSPFNDVCPLHHKVPKISRLFGFTSSGLSRYLNNTVNSLRSAGGNESCVRAVGVFQCSKEFYTCQDNFSYFYFDFVKVYKLCIIAKQLCTGADKDTLDTLLECYKFRNRSLESYNKREITCVEYPKVKNDACPMQNYKIPSYVNFTRFVQDQKLVQSSLRQNNVGKNCCHTVLRVFCYFSVPACTRDEKYRVSLLGKQKCHEMVACLNATNNRTLTTVAGNLCNELPDEDTVKKIPIFRITNPKTREPTNTTKEIPVACCKASRLPTIGLLFMVFTVWLLLDSFAIKIIS